METVVKNFEIRLREEVMKVIIFFDLFDFPLASSEILTYLPVKCELGEVELALDGLANDKKLEARHGSVIDPESNRRELAEEGGLFFLPGRDEIIETRLNRKIYFARKIKKAKIVSRLFRMVPWIKMIAIGNLMGDNNLRDESDIDFFIVTDAKRIWMSRFITVLIIKLLGLRPKIHNLRDKICLSFFASRDALDLSKLRLDDEDIYFDYWLANLFVIFDKREVYDDLISCNSWIKQSLPNSFDIEYKRFANSVPQPAGTMEPSIKVGMHLHMIDWLEKKLRDLQIRIMPVELKAMINKDTRVVVNDKIIKMHSNDRREKYRRRWKEKLEFTSTSSA